MRDTSFPIKSFTAGIIVLTFIFFSLTYGGTSSLKPVNEKSIQSKEVVDVGVPIAAAPVLPVEPVITHINTPTALKGIYVSAYSFMSSTFRRRLDKMIEDTSVNAIVVDIKDAPGIIMFDIGFDHECIKPYLSQKDLENTIKHYHDLGVYIIARVAVFRDACFAKAHPELAVMNKVGQPWRDKGGNYWLAPHEEETRKYIRDISEAVYARGFDEVQLDYIRYPSDGKMSTLFYEYDPAISASSSSATKRRGTIRNFMAYMRGELQGIPLSADVFGMVLTNPDDLTIGQHLDDFVPYTDYISPMIYPSHFPKAWNGIANTHTSPYQTIYDSTKRGLDRMSVKVGSTTARKMMRPWLQDFSIYGVVYREAEVKAQIKALEDLGVHSFLLWNASNRYTPNVL